MYRFVALGVVLEALCLGCSTDGGSSAAPDGGDADTDTDSDSDTGIDSDSDTETDTDSESECDTEEMDDSDVHDGCAEWATFPPSNGPDGCTRTLLTQIDGVGLEWPSWYPRISRDGSVAVFSLFDDPCSYQTDGVPEDTNGVMDVYAVDLSTFEMEMVSVSTEGEPGNAESGEDGASLSADGRYVVFHSAATNLALEEPEGGLFVRDRLLGTTERISGGGTDVVISADGRYVVFASGASDIAPDDDDSGEYDVFLFDRESETTEILTLTDTGESVAGGGGSSFISDDGRYVAFWHVDALCDDDDDSEELSDAQRGDLYVRDRQTGLNRLVSVAPDGFTEGWAFPLVFAPDGSWVMFHAGNSAVHYYDTSLYEHTTGTILAHIDEESVTFEPVVASDYDLADIPLGASTDGRFMAFSGFAQYTENVGLNPVGDPLANEYILDRDTGSVTLVSASDDGTPGIVPDYEMGITDMVDWGDIAISGDGKRTVFTSILYGLVDTETHTIPCPQTPALVYLRDCP